MSVAQQENFKQMIDNVLLDFPVYENARTKRTLNDHLRNLISRRPWSGLVKYGVLSVPADYNTGTVDLTLGSNVVTGTSTAWDVQTIVNTTLSTATTEAGIIDATPASMSGIAAGNWLLIDGGNADEEAVYVISVTATTFRARFTKTHSSAVTIKQSSLAGLQFRRTSNDPMFTVIGVSSTTRMLLDKTWPLATASGATYTIRAVYVSLGQDIKQLLTMVNLTDNYRFYVNVQKAHLDMIDARRDAVQSTHMITFHETDPAGVPLWELYPQPTTQKSFPYMYIRQWAPLVEDGDLLPNGIRSDVLVKRAKAEAARWPGHKKTEGGIYYDPNLSKTLMSESELVDIETMKREDDSTNIMTLLYGYNRIPPFGGGGIDYAQTHDVDGW